mgnify:CR=1 FL=1
MEKKTSASQKQKMFDDYQQSLINNKDILGEEISDVSGFMNTRTFNYEVEDRAIAVFKTKKGVIGEIDVNFNVNVTTDSYGNIMGGSGGHSDTAHGAKVSIITTNLIKSRLPIIKKEVTTITTPGQDIDILVTERGIAINPLRKDLLEKLLNSLNKK